MDNILQFIAPRDDRERDVATGKMLIAGAMDHLDMALVDTLEALEDAGDLMGDDYMLDPYLLLDSIGAIFESLDMDPLESVAYVMLRDCCDYMEIMEEVRDE